MLGIDQGIERPYPMSVKVIGGHSVRRPIGTLVYGPKDMAGTYNNNLVRIVSAWRFFDRPAWPCLPLLIIVKMLLLANV